MSGLKSDFLLIAFLQLWLLLFLVKCRQRETWVWCYWPTFSTMTGCDVTVSDFGQVCAWASWPLGWSGDLLPTNEDSIEGLSHFKLDGGKWGAQMNYFSPYSESLGTCLLVKTKDTVYFWTSCDFHVNFMNDWRPTVLIWSLQCWISFPIGGSENSLTSCWPAGTLDMSELFEDKSCWTVSSETLGESHCGSFFVFLFFLSKILKTNSSSALLMVWAEVLQNQSDARE